MKSAVTLVPAAEVIVNGTLLSYLHWIQKDAPFIILFVSGPLIYEVAFPPEGFTAAGGVGYKQPAGAGGVNYTFCKVKNIGNFNKTIRTDIKSTAIVDSEIIKTTAS